MVHVWVAANIPAGATRLRAPAPVPPFQAWLVDSGDRAAPVAGNRHEAKVSSAPAVVSSAPLRRPGNGRPATREQPRLPQEPSIGTAPADEPPHLTPAAPERIYYPARELDAYPTPLAPLRFEYPARLARAPIAGNVLVTLMVGESGAVDRVAVVAAEPAGYFEEHTRAAFTSARFHPGRRAGRVVGSQITVRVEYDPALGAGLSR
jgi:TonB family protein